MLKSCQTAEFAMSGVHWAFVLRILPD